MNDYRAKETNYSVSGHMRDWQAILCLATAKAVLRLAPITIWDSRLSSITLPMPNKGEVNKNSDTVNSHSNRIGLRLRKPLMIPSWGNEQLKSEGEILHLLFPL